MQYQHRADPAQACNGQANAFANCCGIQTAPDTEGLLECAAGRTVLIIGRWRAYLQKVSVVRKSHRATG